MTVKKPKQKPEKSNKKSHTIDSLSKAVRDISTTRKIEIEDDQELSTAICELADYAGELFTKLLNDAIQNDNAAERKKNKLLVLQLMFMKMSSELLDQEGKIELTSEIPISGLVGCGPICTKKDNVPLYA
jgi:hypothetical protein